MSKKAEVSTHEVGDIQLLSKQVPGSSLTAWYIKCPDCKGEHLFHKTGPKMWHTSCFLSETGYLLTPSGYYVEKSFDLSRIMRNEG
jgi:hypothetical protein